MHMTKLKKLGAGLLVIAFCRLLLHCNQYGRND